MKHRNIGYQMLSGHGIEIGAALNPAAVPARCSVEYCDAVTKAEFVATFPEVDGSKAVEVDHLCDLDIQGLDPFADATFDFAVLNHVIEHVANPIRVVSELFRVVKPGGHVVISAPDKHYTFDKNRKLTPFDHLLEEYKQGVTEVTDEHYIDFIRGTNDKLATLADEQLERHVANVRRRREHVHVWDSASFKAFMIAALDLLEVTAACRVEHYGHQNALEYFSVWQKDPPAEQLPKRPWWRMLWRQSVVSG